MGAWFGVFRVSPSSSSRCIPMHPGRQNRKTAPRHLGVFLNDSGKLITVFELPEEVCCSKSFASTSTSTTNETGIMFPFRGEAHFAGQNLLTNGSLDQFSDLEPDTPTDGMSRAAEKAVVLRSPLNELKSEKEGVSA